MNMIRKIDYRIALLVICLLFSLLLISACGDEQDKLVYNGTEIRYDSQQVAKEKVEELGRYLVETEFVDGAEKTVELAKNDGIWQFRMVVQDEYIDNQEYIDITSIFAAQLSQDVFEGEEVEIHYCDSNLETIKVIKIAEDLSQKIVIEGTEIYFDGKVVTLEDAETLGAYLQEVDFIDGSPKSIQLVKEGDLWQFKMVTQDAYIDNQEYIDLVSIFAAQLSQDLLQGQAVEFHFCDQWMNTIRVIEMAGSYIEKIVIEGTEIYYDGELVTLEDAESLGAYLQEAGFSDGSPKSVQLARDGDVWIFRMVVQDEFIDNEEYTLIFADFAQQLSTDLFSGLPVEINLCNDLFETMQVVKYE